MNISHEIIYADPEISKVSQNVLNVLLGTLEIAGSKSNLFSLILTSCASLEKLVKTNLID